MAIGGTFFTHYQSRNFLEVLNEFSHLNSAPLLDTSATTFHCQQPCNWEEAVDGATFLPNVGNNFLYNGSFAGTAEEANAIATSMGGTFFQMYPERGWLEVLNGFSHLNPTSDNTSVTFQCEKKALEPICVVALNKQFSSATCKLGTTFGCSGSSAMYTTGGCNGNFTCNGGAVTCASDRRSKSLCHCPTAPTSAPTPPTPPLAFDPTPAPSPALGVPPAGTQDLVDLFGDTPDLSELSQAIADASLEETLRAGTFTFFAPNNNAFAGFNALQAASPNQSMSAGQSRQTLLNHLLAFQTMSSELQDGQNVQTAAGTNLTISITAAGTKVNEARIVRPDILATNGVVHIIDSVLGLSVQQINDILTGESPQTTSSPAIVNYTVEFNNNMYEMHQNGLQATNVVFTSSTTYNFTAGTTMQDANPMILIPASAQLDWGSAPVRVRLDANSSETWTPMWTELVVAYSANGGALGKNQSTFTVQGNSVSTTVAIESGQNGAIRSHNSPWVVVATIVLAMGWWQ